MTLTPREQKVLREIRDWEERLYEAEANDFQQIYDRYIENAFQQLPNKVREQIISNLDNWLFHLHSMIQGSELQMDAKKRVIANGRVFDEDIQSVEDMKRLSIDQLQYIADQQISRHRMYSLAQGGISGTGGTLLLGADIPGMAVINLRAVQLIAATYGVEVNTPFEMMTALKVFNAAIHPHHLQSRAWEELMNEIEQGSNLYFYEGNEELANITWLDQLLKQFFKGITIVLFRKKNIQGIPFVSMAIGAMTNYQFTRKVTDFAHKYYQMRYLIEKEGRNQ
ncbi:EcsC family protein [Niallia sp. Krafla_26]|uniref:EcsC family protein n=1 Tax=Niallia sp. Krafla_26 TaxID=3064703 RepID=UPI003D182888